MTSTTRRAALGALASLPALALPAVAIASPRLSVASVLAPAAVPETPPQDEPPAESDEFCALIARFSALFDERNEALDQENATRVRFAAEAPLRPKKPLSKYPHVHYDIVREETSADDMIQTMKDFKAREGSLKIPGLRFKKSVLDAYHDLIKHPFYTKEGELDRKAMGASERWENALRDSADKTGYGPARRRRALAEKGLRELIPEILKQRPKTIEGLSAQAAVCLTDPDVHWNLQPNTLAFLYSVFDFKAAALAGVEGRAQTS